MYIQFRGRHYSIEGWIESNSNLDVIKTSFVIKVLLTGKSYTAGFCIQEGISPSKSISYRIIGEMIETGS